MNSDIFQQQYDSEMARKDKLSASINVPIAIITVLGSAAFSMIMNFKYSDSLQTYLFLIILASSICFLIYAIVLIFKSQIGYLENQKVPLSSDLYNHHKELVDWHISNGDDDELSKSKADIDFEEYFNRRLAEATDRNNKNNIKRGFYLYSVNVKLARALFFLAISSPFYVYANLTDAKTPHKVQIVKSIHLKNGEIIMPPEEENNSSSSGSSNSGSSESTTKPTPTEKPAGPPNIEYRDNSQKIEQKQSAVLKKEVN